MIVQRKLYIPQTDEEGTYSKHFAGIVGRVRVAYSYQGVVILLLESISIRSDVPLQVKSQNAVEKLFFF